MELSVLMELISSCGGHLWLEAQPAGNMVLKIHLPRLAIKEDGGGRLSRWLRAASVDRHLTLGRAIDASRRYAATTPDCSLQAYHP